MPPLNELFNNELREVWQRCNKKTFIVFDDDKNMRMLVEKGQGIIITKNFFILLIQSKKLFVYLQNDMLGNTFMVHCKAF